jgi:hypothetical protein
LVFQSVITTEPGDAVQPAGQSVGGHGAFDQAAEALTSVLVHDGHDLDGYAVGGGVELEVHCPHLVRCVRRDGLSGGGAQAFAAMVLRHAQAFLTPQPLNLSVVHDPALVLATGIVVGRPEFSP